MRHVNHGLPHRVEVPVSLIRMRGQILLVKLCAPSSMVVTTEIPTLPPTFRARLIRPEAALFFSFGQKRVCRRVDRHEEERQPQRLETRAIATVRKSIEVSKSRHVKKREGKQRQAEERAANARRISKAKSRRAASPE